MDVIDLRGAVLARIEQYCADHGLTEAEFGRLAVDDNRFVPRLRDRSIGVTITNAQRAMDFMNVPPVRRVRRRGEVALQSAEAVEEDLEKRHDLGSTDMHGPPVEISSVTPDTTPVSAASSNPARGLGCALRLGLCAWLIVASAAAHLWG